MIFSLENTKLLLKTCLPDDKTHIDADAAQPHNFMTQNTHALSYD